MGEVADLVVLETDVERGEVISGELFEGDAAEPGPRGGFGTPG